MSSYCLLPSPVHLHLQIYSITLTLLPLDFDIKLLFQFRVTGQIFAPIFGCLELLILDYEAGTRQMDKKKDAVIQSLRRENSETTMQ